eukprot:scaffold90928_cov36-Cyclotella_meneghiniana.AAC.8
MAVSLGLQPAAAAASSAVSALRPSSDLFRTPAEVYDGESIVVGSLYSVGSSITPGGSNVSAVYDWVPQGERGGINAQLHGAGVHFTPRRSNSSITGYSGVSRGQDSGTTLSTIYEGRGVPTVHKQLHARSRGRRWGYGSGRGR